MKKTLCKELHKGNPNLFICIEDIIVAEIDRNELVLEVLNTRGSIRLNAKTKKNAKEIHKRLIKEIEEYYEKDTM